MNSETFKFNPSVRNNPPQKKSKPWAMPVNKFEQTGGDRPVWAKQTFLIPTSLREVVSKTPRCSVGNLIWKPIFRLSPLAQEIDIDFLLKTLSYFCLLWQISFRDFSSSMIYSFYSSKAEIRPQILHESIADSYLIPLGGALLS